MPIAIRGLHTQAFQRLVLYVCRVAVRGCDPEGEHVMHRLLSWEGDEERGSHGGGPSPSSDPEADPDVSDAELDEAIR